MKEKEVKRNLQDYEGGGEGGGGERRRACFDRLDQH